MNQLDIPTSGSIYQRLTDIDPRIRGRASRILATRSALRALPALRSVGSHSQVAHADLLLQTIMFCLIARVKSVGDPLPIPSKGHLRRLSESDFFLPAELAALAALQAAKGGVVREYEANQGASAITCADMALPKIESSSKKSEKLLGTVEAEVREIENGQHLATLHNSKLWNSTPDWFESSYGDLAKLLQSPPWQSDGWSIWLEWYEPIVRGFPAFLLKDHDTAVSLEREITIGGRNGVYDESFWNRTPREINAQVAQWVSDTRAVKRKANVHPPSDVGDAFPRQDVAAVTFGLTDDGQIDLLPVPPEQRLLITASQQQDYLALRRDAGALAGLGQQLGKLAVEVAELCAAMPADMSVANVFDLWRALNRLRRTFNAHERVRDLDDPHDARLEPSVAEELGHLLDTANNFAFGDPGLRRRDENAIAPQDRPSIAEEARLGAPLVSVVFNAQGVLTPEAEMAVKAEEKNGAIAGDDQHGLQARDQRNKTRRNLIAAWLDSLRGLARGEVSFSWREFRSGVYKKAGEGAVVTAASDFIGITKVYPKLWEFISSNVSQLIQYTKFVYHNPALQQLLEKIAQEVHRVGL